MPWLEKTTIDSLHCLFWVFQTKRIQLSQFIKSNKIRAHQRILTIMPRDITQHNCPHWRPTANGDCVPLGKGGPQFCSMGGPSSSQMLTFYWKMGHSECSLPVLVLSWVMVNNQASPEEKATSLWEATPRNLQKDRLLKLPAGIHPNTPADTCSLFHQIFNKAKLWKSNKKALVIASWDHLRTLSVKSQSSVTRMVSFPVYLLLHYILVCFLFKPK